MIQLLKVHQVPFQVLGTWHGLKVVERGRNEVGIRGTAKLLHIGVRIGAMGIRL